MSQYIADNGSHAADNGCVIAQNRRHRLSLPVTACVTTWQVADLGVIGCALADNGCLERQDTPSTRCRVGVGWDRRVACLGKSWPSRYRLSLADNGCPGLSFQATSATHMQGDSGFQPITVKANRYRLAPGSLLARFTFVPTNLKPLILVFTSIQNWKTKLCRETLPYKDQTTTFPKILQDPQEL